MRGADWRAVDATVGGQVHRVEKAGGGALARAKTEGASREPEIRMLEGSGRAAAETRQSQ